MTLPPGHPEAVAEGCTCPTRDQEDVTRGLDTVGVKYGDEAFWLDVRERVERIDDVPVDLAVDFSKWYWFSTSCPLHGRGDWLDDQG